MPDKRLLCCVCWYIRTGTRDAVTILGGYAVCEDHVGIVAQGQDWAAIIRAAKDRENDIK